MELVDFSWERRSPHAKRNAVSAEAGVIPLSLPIARLLITPVPCSFLRPDRCVSLPPVLYCLPLATV
jgi:hypothetical protein